MAIEVPDCNQPLTIVDILADPEIPQLIWKEVTIEDAIGRGASGVVSRGIWKQFVKLFFLFILF